LPSVRAGDDCDVSAGTGLLVRIDAKPGKGPDVERMLASSLRWVEAEPGTAAWFALHFGHDTYGIVDVFRDEQSREQHLAGPVAQTIAARAPELLIEPPQIRRFDVLTYKLPPGTTIATGRALVKKGALLEFAPRQGKDEQLERFLGNARTMVEKEFDTTAWFALKLEDGDEAIFDVFPTTTGRVANLVGRVPRALLVHGLRLLRGLPHLELVSVVAAKLPQ
jgi:quinol monooxygenase YgiN